MKLPKIRKEVKELAFCVYLFSLLIVINLFFGMFVWMPSDLSPNFALFFVTIFPIILLGIKIFRKKNG